MWHVFLGQFLVKNAKHGPRTLFERPKSEISESGKYRNRREQRENDPFWPSKHQNSVIFKISALNFVHMYGWQGLFHIYSGFWKFENFPQSFVFENNIFCWLFLKFFKICKNFKMQDSSVIDTFIFNLTEWIQPSSTIENRSVLSSKPFARQRFPQTLISA